MRKFYLAVLPALLLSLFSCNKDNLTLESPITNQSRVEDSRVSSNSERLLEFVLPGVGTFSGAALGAFSGALVGAATFC